MGSLYQYRWWVAGRKKERMDEENRSTQNAPRPSENITVGGEGETHEARLKKCQLSEQEKSCNHSTIVQTGLN